MKPAFVLAIAVLLFATACGASSNTFKIEIGREGKIVRQDTVIAAKDKDTYKAMMDSHFANDEYANKERLVLGSIFYIKKDTRVLVLDYDSFYGEGLYKVRVLEGEEKNRAGYVLTKLVE